MQEVQRVDGSRLGPDEFESRFVRPVRRSRPVIITGVVSEWKAFSSWTWEYLREKVGSRQIEAGFDASQTFGGHREFQKMSFAEYIDKMGTSNYYLQHVYLPDALPELMEDVQTPRFLRPNLMIPKKHYTAWFGPPKVSQCLHFDSTDNLLCQVSGSKRLVLFGPSQSRFLYPYPPSHRLSHNSQVANSENPDLARFPRFAKAKPLTCVLNHGEALYLPPYWWHNVFSRGDNIAVNFWWRRPTQWQMAKLHIVQSPLPLKTKAAGAAQLIRKIVSRRVSR